MKKIIFIIFTFLFCTSTALATNHIYDIDMEIYVDKNGTASITETWVVDGSDGTEWYKVYNNLGNSEITDFTVSMDGNPLTYKKWDVDESLSEKKGYYGINYTSNGLELCFGKYDYNRHEFTLNYKISNFVLNTSDSQVIYWNLIDRLSSVDFENFSIVLSSYYEFPNDLPVWGYGHKGYAYVENGKIYMSNEDDMNGQYVVLLAKFPLNTFNTTNSSSRYDTFDDVLAAAENGSFAYDYSYESSSDINPIFAIFITIYTLFMIALPFILIHMLTNSSKYGFINNKTITKKNTPYFRDIPCNKDIYYANALIQLNNFNNSKASILGAILLKWVKEEKIIVIKNNEDTSLKFNPELKIEQANEKRLYQMMYEASKDGVLEKKELEKWAKKNYSKYLNLLSQIKDDKINELKNEGHIYKRKNKQECKYKNVMDDVLYEDSKKLYGLKLFLEDFSSIDTKEVIEVHLWDEYLMFAYLFGIADKVAKQLKNMYPEYIESLDNNIDFDTILFFNTISTRSISAANSARASAESYSSYSSGGGGFSSGGGGGGSFGGGGGGSR